MLYEGYRIFRHGIFYIYGGVLTLGLFALSLMGFCFTSGRFILTLWWARGILWGMKTWLGVKVELHGYGDLPPQGPYILASKHESMWETIFLYALLKNPVFLVKKSLLGVPLLGWHLRSLGMIPVERTTLKNPSPQGGGKKNHDMLNLAAQAVAQKRPLVIFPEGTRVAPGQKVPYKSGVFTLARAFSLPVIPVALNPGRLWTKHSFFKKPGIIKVVICPAMYTDTLDRKIFMEHLSHTIEETCARLSA